MLENKIADLTAAIVNLSALVQANTTMQATLLGTLQTAIAINTLSSNQNVQPVLPDRPVVEPTPVTEAPIETPKRTKKTSTVSVQDTKPTSEVVEDTNLKDNSELVTQEPPIVIEQKPTVSEQPVVDPPIVIEQPVTTPDPEPVVSEQAVNKPIVLEDLVELCKAKNIEGIAKLKSSDNKTKVFNAIKGIIKEFGGSVLSQVPEDKYAELYAKLSAFNVEEV